MIPFGPFIYLSVIAVIDSTVSLSGQILCNCPQYASPLQIEYLILHGLSGVLHTVQTINVHPAIVEPDIFGLLLIVVDGLL